VAVSLERGVWGREGRAIGSTYTETIAIDGAVCATNRQRARNIVRQKHVTGHAGTLTCWGSATPEFQVRCVLG